MIVEDVVKEQELRYDAAKYKVLARGYVSIFIYKNSDVGLHAYLNKYRVDFLNYVSSTSYSFTYPMVVIDQVESKLDGLRSNQALMQTH